MMNLNRGWGTSGPRAVLNPRGHLFRLVKKLHAGGTQNSINIGDFFNCSSNHTL